MEEIVNGIDIFREAFAPYSSAFIVIGGSACRAVLNDGAIRPRRTRDIDMVLVPQELSGGFIGAFWKFIKDGGYKFASRKNKDGDPRYVFYSFVGGKEGYPEQIELLSKPDFKGSRINGAFVSEEHDFIEECGAEYWIYGHSHRNIDGLIGHTQCVSNQLGYVFAGEHSTFNPGRVIEL